MAAQMQRLLCLAACATLMLHSFLSAFAQAEEEPPLFQSKASLQVLPAMAGQKLIVEGIRTILLDEVNLPPQAMPANPKDLKQETHITCEIVYIPELGIAATESFPSKTDGIFRQKMVVRPEGSIVVAYNKKMVNLPPFPGTLEDSFLFWWPARRLEQLGVPPDSIKPGMAMDRVPIKRSTVSGEADPKGNVKSVEVVKAGKKWLTMKCQFGDSSPIPTHVRVEEFAPGGEQPWKTDDVTITRVPLTKEDKAIFDLQVDRSFMILDYRLLGEPVRYPGSEIRKLWPY
jgi:hypothetical protein